MDDLRLMTKGIYNEIPWNFHDNAGLPGGPALFLHVITTTITITIVIAVAYSGDIT